MFLPFHLSCNEIPDEAGELGEARRCCSVQIPPSAWGGFNGAQPKYDGSKALVQFGIAGPALVLWKTSAGVRDRGWL